MDTAYHAYKNLTFRLMITDAFSVTIELSDWTLFSSSTMVSVVLRLPPVSKPVLLRAGKHPALTMRKPSIKGTDHVTRQ